MDHADDTIEVELAWSPRAGEVLRQTLRLPQGTTVEAAIARSGWELPAGLASAVHGRACDASRVLREGDRLELLRPLAIDPKDARRERQRQTQRPKQRRQA